MHSMVISAIIYCLTTWSLVSSVTLKPLESLYKRTQILYKKLVHFHHCLILEKIKYASVCLKYKIKMG